MTVAMETSQLCRKGLGLRIRAFALSLRKGAVGVSSEKSFTCYASGMLGCHTDPRNDDPGRIGVF